MLRIVVLLAVTLVTLCGWVGRADACSCVAPPPPAEARAQAASVFEGRVVSMLSDEDRVLQVVFEVVRTWKGANAERLEVSTAANEAACGYTFREGESYLVYTDERDGTEWTGLCSRTRPMTEAEEDVVAFGEGITPVDPTGPDWERIETTPGEDDPPARGGCASCTSAGEQSNAPASALLSLLVGGWLFARRRRR